MITNFHGRSQLKRNHSKLNINSQYCEVCSARADCIFTGILACFPCKLFFKRNIGNQTGNLHCKYGGDCQINQITRSSCAYCRLAKCRAVGMRTGGLHDSISDNQQLPLPQQTQLIKIQPLSLLESDRSELSNDEWRLLSNIKNCYDDQCKIDMARNFLIQQSSVPMKIRFKVESVYELIQQLANSVRSLFERNSDFRSLPSNDQSLLLERTSKHAIGLSSTFTLGASFLYDDPGFDQTIAGIFGDQCISDGKLAYRSLDPDLVIVKLSLTMLMFSTLDCTLRIQNKMNLFTNVYQIQSIQDRYAQLTWKYLIYRYDYHYAVKCFSKMIQGIFAAIRSLEDANDVTGFQMMIDSVTEKTKVHLKIV